MNIWELREAIESAIPVELAIVAVIVGLLVAAYGIATRGVRR